MVYLVPTLPGAPSACYRTPRVQVIDSDTIRVHVRLDDGAELTTDIRNVRRRLPSGDPRKDVPRPRRALDGAIEVPLW
jgi:hypothetical protein